MRHPIDRAPLKQAIERRRAEAGERLRRRRSGPVVNKCRGCGSDVLDLVPGKGPHALAVVCGACGRHVRWVGLPIDRAEATRFVIPFGMHKGTPMGELPRDYLAWVAQNVEGRIGERAQVLLEGQQ